MLSSLSAHDAALTSLSMSSLSSSTFFLQRLPSDLLAVVCSFLPLCARFLSLTHLCRAVTSTLTPSCFSGHLLVNRRLPSLSPSSFTRLTAATAMSAECSEGWSHLSFFSAQSPCSLLHLSSLTSLTLSLSMHRSEGDVQFSRTAFLSFFSFLLSNNPSYLDLSLSLSMAASTIST